MCYFRLVLRRGPSNVVSKDATCGSHIYVYSTELYSRNPDPDLQAGELCLGACHTSSRLIAHKVWLAIFVGGAFEFPFLHKVLSQESRRRFVHCDLHFYGKDHRSFRSAEQHSRDSRPGRKETGVCSFTGGVR